MASGVRQVRKINDVKSPIVAHVTSVKICKSHLELKYALVWHQVRDRPEEQHDMKSSIVEHVILVIRIHN